MRRLSAALVLLTVPVAARAADHPAPMVEKYLLEGRLNDGETALTDHLARNPNDAQARYGLGTLQFLQSVEHLAQGLYRYGLRNHGNNFLVGEVPFLRLPVPENPKPDEITYADFRRLFQRLNDDLAKAEATLAKVPDGDVKLPLHIGLIRLDLDGDGKATGEETLWRIYAAYNRIARPTPTEEVQKFLICFDAGDIHWMRGYCHLLMAFGEFILAHDWQEIFNATAHLAFARPKTPFDFLQQGRQVFPLGGNIDVMDLIALIHLIRMPVTEPERMKRSLHHLEAMVAESRVMWKLVLAETDDDHEWIPNPKQAGVIPGVSVSQAMVDGWMSFLDQAEALLQGHKLIPFWRSNDGRGVNLRRVFTEPRPFDLVLWVQGTAAAPYLEKGPLVAGDDWARLERIFGGQFITFMFWFN
jgi:hypothetical protein